MRRICLFLALGSLALTAGGASQLSVLRITSALEAVPSLYEGPCPAVIAFRGTITATGPCSISYRFIRSDGGVGPEQTLAFPAAGSKSVSTTWQLSRTYSGWEAIQILSPVAQESNHAEFTFKCLAGPIVTAELTADPASYRGPCPAKIGFNGRITVSEACLLKYKFVRSDGTRGPEQSLKFDEAGTKSVRETWDSSVPDAGWGAIEILSPVMVPSNKAMFTNRCVNGPTITATLAADPASYTGQGPVTIAFNGTITVSEPCTVSYRFVRSDNGTSPGASLVFPAAGSKPVSTTWQLRSSYTGWVAIQIISPFTIQSNRASFSIICN